MEIFQYFFVGLGIIVVLYLINLVVGFVNYSKDSEGTLRNYARKYIDRITTSSEARLKLYEKVDYIVENVIGFSEVCKDRGYNFYVADEMDYIECTLEMCLQLSSPHEYEKYMDKYEKVARCNNINKTMWNNAWRMAYELFPLKSSEEE